MKYKKGDRVIVKQWDDVEDHDGIDRKTWAVGEQVIDDIDEFACLPYDIGGWWYKESDIKCLATEQYSKEFKKIPPHEMARLMQVHGKVLEFPDGSKSHYDLTEEGCFWIVNVSGSVINFINSFWIMPCRIKQEPKTETRWYWECLSKSTRTQTIDKLAKVPPELLGLEWTKVEGSEEEFVIEGKKQ